MDITYVRHGNYSKTVGCGLKVFVVIDACCGATRENKILLTEINFVGLFHRDTSNTKKVIQQYQFMGVMCT